MELQLHTISCLGFKKMGRVGHPPQSLHIRCIYPQHAPS